MSTVGGSESASAGVNQQSLIPYCGCRVPMRLYVSNSPENLRRRYWKCMNWNNRESCRLFIWDDEITRDEVGVVAVDPKPCSACHYAEISMEAGTRKIEKLKMKAANERKRVFIMGVDLLLVSWICFVVYECLN